MGLIVLVLGLVIVLGAHVFVTFREQRAALAARLGRAYRAIFALVSLVGLVLIIWGFSEYRAHGLVQIWSPPAVMRHIAMPLVLLAVIFLVAAFIPCHIRSWLKHPIVTSVKTWALAHLLANGDLGGIILFGSFLLWGGYSRVAAKRRGDLGAAAKPIPEDWTNDIIAVVLGILIFLALGYWFHPYVIGLPVFGR
ncbi:MAG TPA: NnrU family protein [Pseudolabrys sp.]|jgi:uncharacterized membrane protein